MHRGGLIGGLWLVLFVVSTVISPASASNTGAADGFMMQESDTGVKFEVVVPWEELLLEEVVENGKPYTRVSLPGWAETGQAGAPQLPMLTEQAAVPVDADVELWVVPGEARRVKLSAPVLPVATARVGIMRPGGGLPQPEYVVEEDAGVYGGGEYPGSLAMVMNDGMLRQQRVIGLVVYPVQYDARTNELVVYESLEVEVKYSGGSLYGGGVEESEVYEGVFAEGLLNYESSQEMREPQGMMMRPMGLMEAGGGAGLPWSPPEPGWRVKVREEGFYQVSYVDLAIAGLPVTTLDPRTIKLYHLGQEVAIQVIGENDGKLDDADSIIFYGQGVESKYTWDNVYWLTYGGGVGLRVASKDGAPTGGGVPAYFPATRHYEENHEYFSNTPGSENLDRFYWKFMETYDPANLTWQYKFNTPTRYAGVNAELRLKILGAFNIALANDHHARVTLNGKQVGDARWDGLKFNEMVMSAPLQAGENTLVVTLPNDTGAGFDAILIDWVKVNFPSTFVAVGNELKFTYPEAGKYRFDLTGFSASNVALYDVSDAWNVKEITNASVTGSGSYKVSFSDTIGGETRYMAQSRTLFKQVSAIEADTPSSLGGTWNGADYILITTRDFWDAAGNLANYRAGQGLRSVRVDVQDIYDEFNYGIVNAGAIRDFLKYTYDNWDGTSPSYVVLMGDGHYDGKNYLGLGKPNLIPPYLAFVDPWIGETAADNRYVMVSGLDTIPDMILGRIPVNTAAEAAAFVNKIITYESNTPSNWQQQVLMVADNDETGNPFSVNADEMVSCCIPPSQSVTKVYLTQTHTTPAAAKSAILRNINDGKFIVNYHGHGLSNQWADEGLFKNSDVSGLSNGSKMPIFMVMACYNGFYHYPYTDANADATAEVLIRADGKGAIAVWAATGLGMATGHKRLNEGFYRAYYEDHVRHMGEAMTAGNLKLWSSNNDLDLLDTMLLFGDPALEFPGTPTAVDLSSFTAESSGQTVTLRWESVREVNNLGYNLYRAESPNGNRIRINARLIRAGAPVGSVLGGVYTYEDGGLDLKEGLKPNLTYYYWLEDIDLNGSVKSHGPLRVTFNPAN